MLPKFGLSLHDSSNLIINEMHDLVLKSIESANQASTTISRISSFLVKFLLS